MQRTTRAAMLAMLIATLIVSCTEPTDLGDTTSHVTAAPAAPPPEDYFGCGWDPDDRDEAIDTDHLRDYTVTQAERPITCGWDRCGSSGGYSCTDGNVICVWHRGTSWIECGIGCLRDSLVLKSCYRCTRFWGD